MNAKKTKYSISVICVLILLTIVYIALPFGMPPVASYFESPENRVLQPDEIGQLRSLEEVFIRLSLTGDDFSDWDVTKQDQWKYAIAFAAYGLPSAMIIDAKNKKRYQAMMDNMIWKMKSKKVWGDFTDRGFGSDPISIQNIMYKGHLNLMYGLFQLSTGDKRYAREFTWLTQQLASEMRKHHKGIYDGVTCEPNAWFVQCNTISMLSLHVYDKIYATKYTENEVQWTLNFIFERMSDPDTGLFYAMYQPHHDLVQKRIYGYPNAWSLTFLNPLVPEKMPRIYKHFRESLIQEIGPYATVKGEIGGKPDAIAHGFGLWAAKEFDDKALFKKLRNSTDKFARLQRDEFGGLSYGHKENLLMNGGVVASKLHLGWDTILNYNWGFQRSTIPDVSDMSWRDLLPSRTYALHDNLPLPSTTSRRPCPNCFWGDYNPDGLCLANDQGHCDASALTPKETTRTSKIAEH